VGRRRRSNRRTTIPGRRRARVAADASAEHVVARWLREGDLAEATSGRIDDVDAPRFAPVVEPKQVEILDLFSAGRRVAFHASLSGRYSGGLPDADEHHGKPARLDITGIATVEGDAIADVKVVTDRLGTWSRLTGHTML